MASAEVVRQLLEIDGYIEQLFVAHDDAFERALRDAVAARMPAINVSPNEGKLLYLLTKISGARRVLEVGTLAGDSTLWLASALPADGRVVTLELKEQFASVARENLDRAGLLRRVDIRVGDARRTLDAMIAMDEESFDLVFIDADKEGYPAYLDYALQLTHSGSLILADNVIRDGSVIHGENDGARAIHEFNRKLAGSSRLEAIVLPIMRHKVDGLAIARVR